MLQTGAIKGAAIRIAVLLARFAHAVAAPVWPLDQRWSVRGDQGVPGRGQVFTNEFGDGVLNLLKKVSRTWAASPEIEEFPQARSSSSDLLHASETS
jgi:hypothetical protein